MHPVITENYEQLREAGQRIYLFIDEYDHFTLTIANADNKNYGGIVGSNYGILRGNLAIGATVPAAKDNTYGAITGYNDNGTHGENRQEDGYKNTYFKLANDDANKSQGIFGRTYGAYIHDLTLADVTTNDGAVPTLRDNADNSTAIGLLATLASSTNGHTPVDLGWGAGKYPMQLAGRTLYKDGAWNTLCLPFSLSAAQIADNADFAGATLMTIDVTEKNGFDAENGTLYLGFKTVQEIEAGVPYLVKWEKAADYDGNPSNYDISNPVFEGVTVSSTEAQAVESNTTGLETVRMVGTYSPVSVTADDKSILFLGDANTLYYSSTDHQIRSCRAYFSVPYIREHAGVQARAFALSFDGEEATGISLTPVPSPKGEGSDYWYTIDGRKLSGKPAQRGLYINKGKKALLK